MEIEWDAVDIKGRLVFAPVWALLSALELLLQYLWLYDALPPWMQVLTVCKTVHYTYQSIRVVLNCGKKRYNILNWWQLVDPPALANVGVAVSLLMYFATWVNNVMVMTYDIDDFDAGTTDGHMIALKVIVGFSLLMALTAIQLYPQTAYYILIKGDRSYEMMPVQYKEGSEGAKRAAAPDPLGAGHGTTTAGTTGSGT